MAVPNFRSPNLVKGSSESLDSLEKTGEEFAEHEIERQWGESGRLG